jgi:hypothetical protein
MKVNELKQGHYMFGGKGDVWGNTAHICKSGTMGGTMCGKPTLSSNWCEIDRVQEIGCKECIEAYKKQMLKETVGFEFY